MNLRIHFKSLSPNSNTDYLNDLDSHLEQEFIFHGEVFNPLKIKQQEKTLYSGFKLFNNKWIPATFSVSGTKLKDVSLKEDLYVKGEIYFGVKVDLFKETKK